MRGLLYKIYNLLFLTVLFGIFKNTPIYLLDKILSIFGAFICFFWLTIPYIIKRNQYYTFSKKSILVFFTLFLMCVFTTKNVLHQKLADGISVQLDYIQISILIFYAYAFKYHKIMINDFEWVLKWSIVLNIIILFVFRNYVDTEVSQITGSTQIFQSHFLPKEFIRLGVFYFFILFLKRGKNIFAIISMFLLLYPNLLIYFERGYFVATLMVMVIIVFIIRKSKRVVPNIIIGIFTLFLTAIIFLNFSGTVGSKLVKRYSAVLSGISGSQTDDPSVNYRFQEVTVGISLFTKDIIFGAGRLKVDNSQLVTGINFYPSDVGVIGILASYGLIGLTVYLVMFVKSARMFMRTVRRSNEYSYFTITIAAYLLSLCITSLETAAVMLNPAYWCFLYLLFLYSRNIDERNNTYLLNSEDLTNMESTATQPYGFNGHEYYTTN